MLHYLQNYELLIDKKIETLQMHITELQKSKEKKIAELAQRTKEAKMFEKLKEKHYLDYLNEQKKIEQIEIDEIASKKFVRES
jgi:flagellar FliJ protein